MEQMHSRLPLDGTQMCSQGGDSEHDPFVDSAKKTEPPALNFGGRGVEKVVNLVKTRKRKMHFSVLTVAIWQCLFSEPLFLPSDLRISNLKRYQFKVIN